MILEEVKWIHGSKNCKENVDPPVQVLKYDEQTWILRQNKCIHFEAPFMFLFIGSMKALLLDTGATENESSFPLYSIVNKIVKEWQQSHNIELIVAHTHNHSDHHAADIQFKGKPNTTVVGLSAEDVISFFKLKNWPNENSTFDLGNRPLEIIPLPGHEQSSIAVYDKKTKLLLTGDVFYPGRLYIENWESFKKSIKRLINFTAHHEVSYILGNHIEMTNIPGKDYPLGSTYHPQEHMLPLKVKDLQILDDALNNLGDRPVISVYDSFIIYPTN